MSLIIRVFREGDMFVAVAAPPDIVTQGRTEAEALARFSRQLAMEIELAGDIENIPRAPDGWQNDVIAAMSPADKPSASEPKARKAE